MSDEQSNQSEQEEPIADEEVIEVNPLSMSDEDIAQIELPLSEEPTEEGTEKAEEGTSEEAKESASEEETDNTEEQVDGTGSDEAVAQDKVTEDTEDSKDTEDADTIDYEAEYKKITAPFRANNTEMQVDNIDDALTLMKMGANYNKKMHGLKPHMKLIKMLDNNNLLDEEKLNFLIDLDKKNPDAITKLIKDSGIDPLNVDVNEDTEYKSNTYNVDDKEVELDAVLEDIQDTPTYQDTIEIISNKWDQSSKQVLFNEPGIIKAINDQIASGVYDQIDTVVQRERVLGRLDGISDIEAYRVVGQQLQANNGFNSQQTPLANEVVTKVPSNKSSDPKLKDRKRAASGTKSVPTSKKRLDEFNPLSLSDEDFEKAFSGNFSI